MAASASASLTSSATEEELTMTVKWSGKEYAVRVCGDDSVAGLKRRICELTNVLPKREKLLYPKISNKLADSAFLSQLPLKFSLKKTMIGTVEDDIIVNQMDSPEIIDDFELGQDEAVDIEDVEVNKQKLRRRIDQYEGSELSKSGKSLLADLGVRNISTMPAPKQLVHPSSNGMPPPPPRAMPPPPPPPKFTSSTPAARLQDKNNSWNKTMSDAVPVVSDTLVKLMEYGEEDDDPEETDEESPDGKSSVMAVRKPFWAL